MHKGQKRIDRIRQFFYLWSFLIGLLFPTSGSSKQTLRYAKIHNYSFMAINIFCQVVAFLYPTQILLNNSNNNILIQFTIWNQIYVEGLYSLYICYKVTIDNDKYQAIEGFLDEVGASLERAKVPPTKLHLTPLIFLIVVTNVGLIAMQIDISNHGNHFFSAWTLYLPMSIHVVIIVVSIVFIDTSLGLFKMMNMYLTSLLDNYPTIDDKLNAVLSGEPPKRHQDIKNIVLKNFSLLTKCLKCFNNYYGVHYVVFFYITILTTICQFYSLTIDVKVQEVTGVNTAQSAAIIYWPVTFFLLMVYLSVEAQRMLNESEKTGSILYRLVNIYPELNEQILIHGMQLSHQQMKITAADLFDINFSVVGGIVVVIMTYCTIFIQIGPGLSEQI